MDTAALSRVVSLLEPGPDSPDMSAGYLDLLGDAPEGRSTFAQSLMISRWIPEVYERWWRPALGQDRKSVV